MLVLALFLSLCPFGSAGGASAQTPGAPTLIAPANGTTSSVANYAPLGIPDFRWSAVEGATEYHLQVSSDIAFTPGSNTTDYYTKYTTFTPTSSQKYTDGTWYWRVRKSQPAPVGAWSDTFSFQKDWASDDNKPNLTGPADGATLSFVDTPTFTWEPVIGAASYSVQIVPTTPSFPAPSRTTINTTYQYPTPLAAGLYYWRVVPLDPNDREGMPSQVRQFTVAYSAPPQPLTPANDATPPYTPTFSWTAVRGAQFYRLEYSTDPTLNTGVTTIETRSTSFTPDTAIENDQNYYWRVRGHYNGTSVFSAWSPIWSFRKQWYFKPQLLTPTNGFAYSRDPFFSWSPVPGAKEYRIEVSEALNFSPISISATTVNPFYLKPEHTWEGKPTWYWRVTPIDGSGNPGQTSDTSSFNYCAGCATTPLATDLLYPLYYYTPSNELDPKEDRTVPLPVFVWTRLLTAGVEVPAYRLQVDDDPGFGSPAWTFDTENLSAVPTQDLPFTPVEGTLYYWRVRPLTAIGGSETHQWSQKWVTKIDLTHPTRTLPAQPTLTLLRPTDGYEAVDVSPLLEWFPLDDPDPSSITYEVQITLDSAAPDTYEVERTRVPYTAYSPRTRLAPGTYYWRVQALKDGTPTAGWSPLWRFQVAAQTQWLENRTLGAHNSAGFQIGSDDAGDMGTAEYDLTTLYATQSKGHWYFGFDVQADTAEDVRYALYLDLDHVDASGADVDPRGYSVGTISAHRPEYAIYVNRSGGVFNRDNVLIYRWLGSYWDANVVALSEIDGDITGPGAGAGYVEVKIPNTSIGMQSTTGSASVALFSVKSSGGHAQDTVPSDPNVDYSTRADDAGTTVLSRFTSVSERMVLATPFSDTLLDPTTLPSLPPLTWHWPAGTPWEGFKIQIAVEPNFNSPEVQYTQTAGGLHLPLSTYSYERDLGDNTYYWRVAPQYSGSLDYAGAWSQPARLERQGLVPTNLQTSVTFATPTFSWNRAEGAELYELQVDDDPQFGSPAVTTLTRQTSYTPRSTLGDGSYYWRVRVKRRDGVTAGWTNGSPFVLSMPTPNLLEPSDLATVSRAPTMCWGAIVASPPTPVLAAWKYRVQVSQGNPNFSSVWDTIDTHQTCWTPIKGYDDGTYYWRVAMIDGDNKIGAYSSARSFTKQYPVTTLLRPISGNTPELPPMFEWTTVHGASSYRLQVSKYPTFWPLEEDINTTVNVRYMPTTKTYVTNQVYYWRVAIVDRDGKIGPWTNETVILDPYRYKVYIPLAVK